MQDLAQASPFGSEEDNHNDNRDDSQSQADVTPYQASFGPTVALLTTLPDLALRQMT